GNIDVAVTNFADNTVSVLLGNGDGTFGAAVNYPTGNGPHALSSGDFNDDGFSDLVVTNNVSGTVSVLFGNGDGTFSSAVNYTVGAQPRFVVATDLDGDGVLDLAVTSNADNVISVLSGKGGGTFAAPVNFATGSTPNDLQRADLDGDGKPDLVAANFGSGSISILINNASPCTNFDPLPGQVVEFYNNILDNFFITGDPIEQKAVRDGAAGPGWCVTGEHFTASGPSKVCRFYGSLSPGPNSHFYTIDPAECQQLKDLQATTPITQKRWNFESNDFSSASPVGGACGAGLIPVYRAYNDGFAKGIDSNHRITSNAGDYMAQIANGWKGEGIVMCAPAPPAAE
ncbi:MAG: VCBS repeat-containing protein, partial [Sphingomicrobium sp.]